MTQLQQVLFIAGDCESLYETCPISNPHNHIAPVHVDRVQDSDILTFDEMEALLENDCNN